MIKKTIVSMLIIVSTALLLAACNQLSQTPETGSDAQTETLASKISTSDNNNPEEVTLEPISSDVLQITEETTVNYELKVFGDSEDPTAVYPYTVLIDGTWYEMTAEEYAAYTETKVYSAAEPGPAIP